MPQKTRALPTVHPVLLRSSLALLCAIGIGCNKDPQIDGNPDGSTIPDGGDPTTSDLGMPVQNEICSMDRYCFRNPLPQGNGFNGVYVAASGEIVAVGDRGTIMRYAGGVWNAEYSGSQSLLNAVWGPSPQDLWVVGEKGLILRYVSGTWKTQAPVTTFLLNGIHGVDASNI
ncbi:MAG TPA: hypothetical protein PK472_10710, partial [Pseudomonadota bacterium]|nr:hypothetical protein [Pseudomonadota bacterium]